MSSNDNGKGRKLALLGVVVWFLLATLPHLGDFPLLDWPQMGICAPAHKLASEGIYGNDLYRGWHRNELRNYEYMPAYPLLVALSFRLFGTEVASARAVSVLCGLATLVLTWWIGRRLFGAKVGLVAAVALVALRPGLVEPETGIPLLDFSRVIRYDVMVPAAVLASCWCLLAGFAARSALRRIPMLLAAGALSGVGTLAQPYGGFVLLLYAAVLVWHLDWRRALAPLAWVGVGWLVAVLPWLLYVLADLDAYVGQMSRHSDRFQLLSPAFYWHNLLAEPWRYGPWTGGSWSRALLTPRVGVWILLFAVPAGMWLSLLRLGSPSVGDASTPAASARRLAARLLLLSVPLLGLQMALLLLMKRYIYVLLLLPFLALLVGVTTADLWRRSKGRAAARGALVVVAALALAEGGWATARTLRRAAEAPSYRELCARIAASLTPGSTVLMSQPYWLGLLHNGDYEMLSVNLVFQLAGSTNVEPVMARLDPDFVVIEDHFLGLGSGDPRTPSAISRAGRIFAALRADLERRCQATWRDPDPHYGPVSVYDCR